MDFLISKVKKAFIYLQNTYIKAWILGYFDIERYIYIETHVLGYVIDRLLNPTSWDPTYFYYMTYKNSDSSKSKISQ